MESESMSEYERIRQENIIKNHDFLSSIGIQVNNHNGDRKSLKRIRDVDKPFIVAVPTRRSSRLRENNEKSISDQIVQDSVESSPKTSQSNHIASEASNPIIRYSKPNHIRPEPLADSSRAINANINIFLDQNLLGIPVKNYGKLAVMEIANHGRAPRFSKYSGIVEWNNCVFLWVNIFSKDSQDKGTYANEFMSNGTLMKWFGGSRMTSDTDSIQRLVRCSEKNVMNDDVVLLFVRLEGGNYACLGRLRWESCNIDIHPVTFIWKLMDYDKLHQMEYFQTVLKVLT